MSDARWNDPRDYDDVDRADERARTYGDRDRDDHEPRDALMRDVDLPRGEERELVVDRDRVYELNGEDSRTLAVVGTFRVVPEQDLDADHDTVRHLRDEGLDEAFLFAQSIDATSCERQRDRLRDELTLASIDHHAEALDELDAQGVLAFAERVLPARLRPVGPGVARLQAAAAAAVLPGRNRVRRNSIQSNRRNGATFQLLRAGSEC